jgi:type IV secretory pathway TrbD component
LQLDVLEFIYVLQYVVAIGVIVWTLKRLMEVWAEKTRPRIPNERITESRAERNDWVSAGLGFIIYLFAYLTGFVISMIYAESVGFQVLTRIETLGLAIMTILTFVEVFITIVPSNR